VTLESPVSDDTAAQFTAGVQLHNEKSLSSLTGDSSVTR
jgi:16S rRNA pseudouridine516 synthase